MANQAPDEIVDSISGSSLLAIRKGAGRSDLRETEFSRYRIDALWDGTSIAVTFSEKPEAGTAGERHPTGRRWKVDLDARAEKIPPPKGEASPLLESLDGESLLSIEAAARVYESWSFDLSFYAIRVVSKQSSHVVIFVDRDRDPLAVGSGGPQPGFEVELSLPERKTVHSAFLR